MRLDKFLCDMTGHSRKQVKEFVKKGFVQVNGVTAKKSDIQIKEDSDTVTFDGEDIIYEKFRYFMLSKPAGVVSATRDNLNKTVIDLLKDENTKDLAPVGRLDIDTEGLLLITNDGALTHHLLSPSHHIDKTYYARTDGIVDESHIELFRNGVDIGDDKPTLPATLVILNVDVAHGTSEIELTITEGRFHQVKRMFNAIGQNLTYLKRLSMGDLKLDESLAPGEYRRLTKDEIKTLTTS